MKRSLLIAVLVASLASAGFATAAATRPLDVTLRGTVTESGVSGCCAIYWNFEGTTMIRGLGFVNFTGSYADVTLYLSQQSRRVLYLELAAPNGDTLTLTGEVNTPGANRHRRRRGQSQTPTDGSRATAALEPSQPRPSTARSPSR
jgi:hypothetical protein